MHVALGRYCPAAPSLHRLPVLGPASPEVASPPPSQQDRAASLVPLLLSSALSQNPTNRSMVAWRKSTIFWEVGDFKLEVRQRAERWYGRRAALLVLSVHLARACVAKDFKIACC
uniref:Uncharacterized protein n=1 Tax=Setaria viridis TaxID=4556 RepID=A0A4U6W0S3_SETVI|nr:hypothetical protein SEVIR_2G409900v2 [Setaria viridis]